MLTYPLLTEHGILGWRDAKTVRLFRFEVPGGTEALRLRLEYRPKRPSHIEPLRPSIQAALDRYFIEKVTDEVYVALPVEEKEEIFKWAAKETRNLLGFSLFDPGGVFRGWWDLNREDTNPQVLLSERVADPGFVAGEIRPGIWRLELEIHGLVTNECRFYLDVEAVTGLGASQHASPAVVHAQKSSVEGPRWYKGELHLHTYHSDGRFSLREMAESARRAGLDYIAVTDHNSTAAFGEQRDGLPVTVIPGLEFTTFHGHALALGISTHIAWTEDGFPRNPSRLADEVRDQGGLFCLSHPNTVGDPVCTGCEWTDERLQAASLDLVEVWHGDYEREAIGTTKALLLWEALLLEGYRVVAVGGGDVHDLFENSAPGMPFTMVYAESDRCEHLLEGLRRGNVYISREPLVELSVQAGDVSVRMGEEVEFLYGSLYVLRLDAKGVGRGAYVRIFRESQIYVQMPLPSTRDTQFELRCIADEEQTWYRAEIYRFNRPRDQLLAVTNVIYVRARPTLFWSVAECAT